MKAKFMEAKSGNATEKTAGKIIPWWSPQLTGKEYSRLQEVLDSNYLNDGDVTACFEKEIARLVECKHSVAVTSGTAAIFLGLAALGVGQGDDVIVPDITFIATANAVKLTGATPVLVDINPRTLNMCPQSLSRSITPKTRAIVPVHVSGRGADMKAIMQIAESHGIPVVEDAAEAFMSKHDGKFLGTIGQVGCFSFSPNKTITTGQGGMVLTNDDKILGRLRELKDHGRPVKGTGGDDIHHSVGFNFKMTNMQAAVGLAQLEALHSRLARQKQIYSWYSDGLRDMDGLVLPGFNLQQGECPLWTDAIIERRDQLDLYLKEKGVHCRRFWFPIHTQSPYMDSNERFRNSMSVSNQAIWLPSAFTLGAEDITTVCDLIRNFYKL